MIFSERRDGSLTSPLGEKGDHDAPSRVLGRATGALAVGWTDPLLNDGDEMNMEELFRFGDDKHSNDKSLKIHEMS